MALQIATLIDGLAWPESPRWQDGYLWFSDVHNFRLMKIRPGEPAHVVAHIPGRPAGLGFMPDGRLLIATALDKKLWWVSAQGELELAVDLSGQVNGLLNDMVVDGNGRAWVGDTGFDLLKGEPEVPGNLLTWAEGSAARVAATNVLFPNGIAIDGDRQTLYLAETFGQRISAFRMQADGVLTDRRVQIELEGRPDGLCIDAEGALWVPLLWQQEFQHIGNDGSITERIRFERERAISCVLGGADRRTLFLGVAEINESEQGKPRRYGAIKHCQVSVAGAGVP